MVKESSGKDDTYIYLILLRIWTENTYEQKTTKNLSVYGLPHIQDMASQPLGILTDNYSGDGQTTT